MFELPEDLSALSQADLDALAAQVRKDAETVLAQEPPASPTEIAAARDAYKAIVAERADRVQAEVPRSELTEMLAEPDEPVTPDPEPADEPEDAPAEAPALQAVTASKGRTVATRSTLDAPPPEAERPSVIMVTAPDVPGAQGGVQLKNFHAAAEVLDTRLSRYPVKSSHSGDRPMPVAPGRFVIAGGRQWARHGSIVFQRQFPKDLRIIAGEASATSVVLAAAKESRLPGGSLVKSAEKLVAAGRSLTAAVGWCAPSEVIYNLCDLTSMDGLLDLPEVQASRGGFQLPENGGPDFSIVWDGIGDAGDVILSEYDIENGAEKLCFEIPCPDFVDVRLDAAYLCLTGSLLQRRGYPEVIELFSSQAVKALAHKVNASVISRIVTASGAAIVIPADASGDDAASALLSAVDLAITDAKYRNRSSLAESWEVVLPIWVMVQIRAALARRYGVAMLSVTDAMIMSWFAERKAVPRFVYDWQDAMSGLVGGPGGSTPLTALPTTVQFLVYPAGTWTKIVRDVVNLDTIYDNALLTTNNYTALFVEDGFNVIQTCPESRLYTVTVDPSGVVGCCA